MAKTKQPGEDNLIIPKDAASESFVKGLVARGEAAHRNQDGTLPPGVTHEIVGQTDAGLPILRRERIYGLSGARTK